MVVCSCSVTRVSSSQAVPGSGTADTQPVLEAQSSSTVDIGGNADDALDSDQDMDTSLEDKSVENHELRFKSSKSNMELFANSKKQEVSAKKAERKKRRCAWLSEKTRHKGNTKTDNKAC